MKPHMTEEPAKSRLRQQIDENLKRIYEDALKEEVPDRLKRLLEELKKKGSET